MKSNTQDCMNIIPEGVWRQLIRHKTGTDTIQLLCLWWKYGVRLT